MLVVSYDFSSNKRRARFSRFLKKFGRRFQYSVFQLKNSKRVLRNVMTEIEGEYEKDFTNEDSIVIIPICKACEEKIKRYGYAKNEENNVIII
jgi:CRISPR-associated protein Cas2